VLGFQAVGIVCSCGLCLRFAGSSPQTGHTTPSSTSYRQLENQAPNTTGSNHLYNTLELLMMDIMVSETCWANNKICNKNSSVASSWHFISTWKLCACLPYKNGFVYTSRIFYVVDWNESWFFAWHKLTRQAMYRGADKSLAGPTSQCILFDVSLVIYTNSTNIPPIMIINKIYETQNECCEILYKFCLKHFSF
jgi:hypothetical protein